MVKIHFNTRYRLCWFLHVLCRVDKEVPTFLALPTNFSMSYPCFLRRCFQCQAANQHVLINFGRSVGISIAVYQLLFMLVM